MDNEELFNTLLSNIRSKVTDITYSTWFKNAKLVSINNKNITIEVSGTYIKNYLLDFYKDFIDEILQKLDNGPYTFDLVTEEEMLIKKTQEEKEEKVIIEIPKYKGKISNLNPNYTFSNFFISNSNDFAQNIALSVAMEPGKLYNPLFIYGKSGLGKTHLMHAIGNYIEENSDNSVLYATSDRFMTDFTQIYKGDNNLDLKQHFDEKYKGVDVLIIDDIQYLRGASKSQEEFFNTFNDLYGLNKQIIISSDRSPDDLKILEDRLRTRFNWGIVVNIYPPDYELKMKIIKNRISGHEVLSKIKPEALEYIANNCESDIRHLEGTVNRLYAYAAMYNPEVIDLEFAQEALRDYVGNNIYTTNNVAIIQKAVAEYFDLTIDSLKSKKRHAEINHARQIAMYLCKYTTEETFERIGLEFNRNHSTVISACDKIEKLINKDEEVKKQIKEIKDKIAGKC